MASKFNVTPDGVQLGLSVFSNEHKVLADLNTTTNLTNFQNATETAEKPPGKFLSKNIFETIFAN